MRLLSLLLATLAAALAPASTGLAQRPAAELDIERFVPAPDRDGFLGFAGSRTPGPGVWNVLLSTAYSSRPLRFTSADDGSTIPVVEHRLGQDVLIQLGATGRLAFLVNLPFIAYQDARGNALDGGPELAVVAVRDPRWAARVRILGEEADGRNDRHEGPGLALEIGGRVPLGQTEQLAGEGAPQLEASLIGDFHFLDFGVGAFLGYRHRFAEPELLLVRYTNEIRFGAAIQAPTILIPNLSAILETRIDTAVDDQIFTEASTAVELDLGFRWAERDGDIALTFAVGFGLVGGPGTPGVRGIFGFSYAPREHDLDGDGLPDALDGCPQLPEDFDGFEDEDGCADPDNDGDLIPDPDDRCPNEAAPFESDEDEDGCVD